MIELGLARISALLQRTPQTWKAIHVAGTNGKGSICTYLHAMLRANNVSCGRFTSPHLMDRWDCIAVNDAVVAEARFRHFEDLVKKRNDELRLGASEFELLTATAFEIFEAEKVEVGVVEVGLGGRLDATNVLANKAVTIITKIGLDHQSFLGNTLEDIALQKAGIMRRGVPCIADSTNPRSVLKVFESHAEETGAALTLVPAESSDLAQELKRSLEPHQTQNLALAHEAIRLAYPQYAKSLEVLVPAIRKMVWPGRLQTLNVSSVTSRKAEVLLDGAHNPQSAAALSTYVEKHLRDESHKRGVTWVLAASEGKDFIEILRLLLRPQDQVVAVAFGAVDGMPWVKAMDPQELLHAAAECQPDATCYNAGADIQDALRHAAKISNEGPLVIAGSLYLVSDVLKLLRTASP